MECHNKIKILYLIDELYGFGGVEKHLFQLASGLDRNRFECTVCPFIVNPAIIEIFRNKGISVEPIPLKRIYGLTAFKQAQNILRLIKKRQIDIVQTYYIGSDIYGTLIAKYSGGPLIVSSRRDLGTYRKNRHLIVTKFLDRYVNHYLAVCHAVAQKISTAEGIPSQKISVIYNGFDLSLLNQVNKSSKLKLRNKFGIGPNSFVIGNVSHFRPEKGYNIFFQAIRKIKSRIPELRVLCVGGFPSQYVFNKAMKEVGLNDFLFFTGYVENVLNYIQLMDICCFTPISNEGFSNAILEQMVMGKAVIASDVGGNKEAIVDGESGFIIPANDANTLAEKIIELYNNEHLRKAIGDKARCRIYEKFDLTKMISQMEEFYTNLITDKFKKVSNIRLNLEDQCLTC